MCLMFYEDPDSFPPLYQVQRQLSDEKVNTTLTKL